MRPAPRFGAPNRSYWSDAMPMQPLIPYFGLRNIRVMTFVDGENLATRLPAHAAEIGAKLRPSVAYRENVYAWDARLSGLSVVSDGAILRTHYYTALQGDDPTIERTERELKSAGVDAPRVFKKPRGSRSKRVDVTLATEMLLYATRKHYDIAVIVTGDEDFVPLVDAVRSEGCGVHLWSVPNGLSHRLVQAVDHYADLTGYLTDRVD